MPFKQFTEIQAANIHKSSLQPNAISALTMIHIWREVEELAAKNPQAATHSLLTTAPAASEPLTG